MTRQSDNPLAVAGRSGRLRDVARFVSYVSGRYALFHVVLVLTVVVFTLEYLATSLMIPMAPGSQQSTSQVVAYWTRIVQHLGLAPEFRSWIWIFFLLMIGRLLLGYVVSVLTTLLGRQVHATLSRKVFGHVLQREPMASLYTRSVGYYISLAGDDAFKGGTIVTSIMQAAVGLLTALIGLVVLFQFSPDLFYGVAGFLAVCLLCLGFLVRMMVRLNAVSSANSRDATTTFVEALNSIRSLRSLGGEAFVSRTYESQMKTYIRSLVELEAVKLGVKAFPAILLLVMASVVLAPGSSVSFSDAMLFASTVIVIRVFASLGQLVTAGSQLLTDVRAAKDIGVLVNLAGEQDADAEASAAHRLSSVLVRSVDYSYPGRPHVLRAFSQRFDPGRTYAIIGPSGAGKSTLADVLLGHASPQSGEVLFNEGRMSAQEARSQICLVEQQPKIFSTTIRENLTLGRSVAEPELWDALRAVGLDGLVLGLPHHLDERLSYLGENFSGGQRQRLGVARALVRHPGVLILDEATSALDSTTRSTVVDQIRARMTGGIVVFITHDPEIAALADEVIQIGS